MTIALRIIIALAVALGIAKVSFGAERCDLALHLSFDTSGSMDNAEHRQTLDGTAAALRDPEVIRSFAERGVVYVQVVEWAERQSILLDWMRITSAQDVEAIAVLLMRAPRASLGEQTALGTAMLFAATQMERVPALCDRLVVDIAGDGESNHGPHPNSVRDGIDPGIMINGLATTDKAANFYEAYVIQGAGAFVEVAAGAENFAEAMKRKLTMELNLS